MVCLNFSIFRAWEAMAQSLLMYKIAYCGFRECYKTDRRLSPFKNLKLYQDQESQNFGNWNNVIEWFSESILRTNQRHYGNVCLKITLHAATMGHSRMSIRQAHCCCQTIQHEITCYKMTLKTRSSDCKSKNSTFCVFERQRAKLSTTAIRVNIYD